MSFFGTSWDDPKTAAIMGIAGGLLQGNAGAGLQQGLLGAQRQSQINAQTKRMEAQDAMDAEKFGIQKQQWQAQLDAAKAKQFNEQQVREILPRVARGEVDAATAIAAGVPAELIKAIKEAPNLGRSKVARTVKGMGPDGREYEYQVDEYGQRVGDGLAQFKAPLMQNLNDKVVALDPYTLKPQAQFAVGMSPSERDASQRGWAANSIAQQRLEMDKGQGQYQFSADLGGYVPKAPGGQFVPLQNMPTGAKAGNATEGERKAATLLKRMEGSLGQLNTALEKNPSAAKPELLPSLIAGMPGPSESTANFATSAPRQQVEAAQLDILDAALTLGTGAAYTKEQLEGYRKAYFPQLGDSAGTVQDKQKRLQNVLEAARIAAGRAAPGTARPTPAGQDILNAADAILKGGR